MVLKHDSRYIGQSWSGGMSAHPFQRKDDMMLSGRTEVKLLQRCLHGALSNYQITKYSS